MSEKTINQTKVLCIKNWIGGSAVKSRALDTIDLHSPLNGRCLNTVPNSQRDDIYLMVTRAEQAQVNWTHVPVAERIQCLLELKQQLSHNESQLAECIHTENGKSIDEACTEIQRGIATIDHVVNSSFLFNQQHTNVTSTKIRILREPLGLVAGITPFSHPLLIPLWLMSIPIALGNAFILKPSEQSPLTALKLAALTAEAGFPDGLFSVIHGNNEVVYALCAQPQIKAIAFVGSNKTSKNLRSLAMSHGKRFCAPVGTKNHVVVMPDANAQKTSQDIVNALVSCTGQRCSSPSVLIAIGKVDHIIDRIVDKLSKLKPGKDFGPVINQTQCDVIKGYLSRAEKQGAKLRLDGRLALSYGPKNGYYMGASIIDHAHVGHEATTNDIFGPVLTVIRVTCLDEAVQIENNHPQVKASVIYTSCQQSAQEFCKKVNTSIVRINMSTPERESPLDSPSARSLEIGELTNQKGVDFWTSRKTITGCWN